jgi:hypothetical protein
MIGSALQSQREELHEILNNHGGGEFCRGSIPFTMESRRHRTEEASPGIVAKGYKLSGDRTHRGR